MLQRLLIALILFMKNDASDDCCSFWSCFQRNEICANSIKVATTIVNIAWRMFPTVMRRWPLGDGSLATFDDWGCLVVKGSECPWCWSCVFEHSLAKLTRGRIHQPIVRRRNRWEIVSQIGRDSYSMFRIVWDETRKALDGVAPAEATCTVQTLTRLI